jgi:hypothetical protein
MNPRKGPEKENNSMFRSRIRTLVVLACLPLMACLHALGQYNPSLIMNALQSRQPGLTLVAAHRGEINGAYGDNMPENSIGAGQNAADAGIEMIEVDVYTTQDHVAYLMHDKTLLRMLQLNQPSAYVSNPTPANPAAPNWSAIDGLTLCGGRGVTDVTAGGTGACTTSSPAQTVPRLLDFTNAMLPAQNQQGQPWGGGRHPTGYSRCGQPRSVLVHTEKFQPGLCLPAGGL